ncbi:major facilitator superfamily domain-containing protein [Lipomyces kononenkoae]|uniref:Major facilitator superfamily domain-containing protein n=1 Tax=Lipomyces kononenkoae TaxID=34357 RepID=A0ACC3SUA0_LIPKO
MSGINECGEVAATDHDNWSSETSHDKDIASYEASATEKRSGPDPSAFPDGGWEAWLAVAGGFFTVFSSIGWINCIGVFQNYYQTNQLKFYSTSTVSWITSTESFMMFFWGPVAGKLVDNYGPRWPILAGTFLHVFGLMMTSISTEYYQIFLAQAVCSAIGCSFLFYPTLAAIGTWFRARRAFAFGIITAGSSLGGVVLPIMVEKLIIEVGFGWAMRSVAFMLLGLLIFANATLKSRLPPLRRPVSLMDFIRPYFEITFLLLSISSFFLYIAGFLPFNYLIVQAEASGMSTSLAGYLIPILNAASTFGRILPGYLADKTGTFNVMIIFAVFSGIVNLALWLPARSNAPIIVFACLYGFASGCTLTIIPAMVAQISDIRQLGVRTGALYVLSSVGVLVGSPIAGAIVSDQHGQFSGLMIFCGVVLLVGAIFAILSRYSQVGFKLIVKV